MQPRHDLWSDIGLGSLWGLGTVGRSLVFVAWLAAVVVYDNWEANRYPDGGRASSSSSFWPAEAAVAGVWALVDGWRRLSWPSLLVRWGLVALVAGLGLTVAEIRLEGVGLYTWVDSPANVVSQLVVIVGGAAAGAAIGRHVLPPSRER